jgi:hypothetical protein
MIPQSPRIVLIATLAMLTACATQSDVLRQCPDIGINVYEPDFTKPHDAKSVADFYDCLMQGASNNDSSWTLGSNFSNARLSRDDLKYQALLWTQLVKKEKTPTSAQESWMVWAHTQNAIEASEDAAYASRRPILCNGMPGMWSCY